MAETEYLKAKSMFSSKLNDLLGSLQFMEEQVDDIYKINMYLIRRYQDDLIKDLGIERPAEVPEEALTLARLFKLTDFDEETAIEQTMFAIARAKILEIMKEEMPDPWYCYGLGLVNINKNNEDIIHEKG